MRGNSNQFSRALRRDAYQRIKVAVAELKRPDCNIVSQDEVWSKVKQMVPLARVIRYARILNRAGKLNIHEHQEHGLVWVEPSLKSNKK